MVLTRFIVPGVMWQLALRLLIAPLVQCSNVVTCLKKRGFSNLNQIKIICSLEREVVKNKA
jgi:hypothetical protein